MLSLFAVIFLVGVKPAWALTITPSTPTAGVVYTISGTSTDNTIILNGYSGSSCSGPIVFGATTWTGPGPYSFDEIEVFGGSFSVIVSGDSSGCVAYTVAPPALILSITPNPVELGGSIQISGGGFVANVITQAVFVASGPSCFGKPAAVLFTSTDGSGNLVPLTFSTSTLALGTHCVFSFGAAGDAQGSFLVTTGAVGGVLMPVNGFAVLAPWLAVIGLVGCIGTAVVAAKKRRP